MINFKKIFSKKTRVIKKEDQVLKDKEKEQ